MLIHLFHQVLIYNFINIELFFEISMYIYILPELISCAAASISDDCNIHPFLLLEYFLNITIKYNKIIIIYKPEC